MRVDQSPLELRFLRTKLCFLYRLMVAAVPLMEFAADRSNGALADYYATHIPEELGHDEMLRADLERMGVTAIPHYFEAAMIAGSQYYLVAHDDPALLLGYIHVMEANAPKVEDIERLQLAYNVRLDCMLHHAKVDAWHVEELKKQYELLPPEMLYRVQWNENNVLRMFKAAMRGIYTDTIRSQDGKQFALAA